MGLTILPPAFCQLTERNETEQQGKNSLPPHCLSVFHFATDWLKKKKGKSQIGNNPQTIIWKTLD